MKGYFLQEILAKDVLGALQRVYPDAIIAGGAARDFSLCQDCNDVDIYLHADVNFSSNVHKARIEEAVLSLGANNIASYARQPPLFEMREEGGVFEYAHNENIRNICDFAYRHVRYQIILLNNRQTPEEIVSGFSCSICEAYIAEHIIHRTARFNRAVDSKVILINENEDGESFHLKKMRRRFEPQGYTFRTFEGKPLPRRRGVEVAQREEDFGVF